MNRVGQTFFSWSRVVLFAAVLQAATARVQAGPSQSTEQGEQSDGMQYRGGLKGMSAMQHQNSMQQMSGNLSIIAVLIGLTLFLVRRSRLGGPPAV